MSARHTLISGRSGIRIVSSFRGPPNKQLQWAVIDKVTRREGRRCAAEPGR